MPLPPFELANRVTAVEPREAEEMYRAHGAQLKGLLVDLLPPSWSFEGKRVLDFGCGAGRVLRCFAEEAETAGFYGCDIHRPSVEWMEANLVPPFNVFANEEAPPLPFEDGRLDLIYAVSVFTHLTDLWSAWLVELHRCLGEGGILIVSVMGGSVSQQIAGEDWDPDRVGMNVLLPGNDRDWGGPMVFHSQWWIAAHWGRAFELVNYVKGKEAGTHDWLVLAKKPVAVTAAALESPEPDEPREALAAQHNVRQLSAEMGAVRAQRERAYELLRELKASPSWRLTAPLRAAKRFARRSRG